MKKAGIIRIVVAIMAITALLLVVRSRAAGPAKEDVCKESMDACPRQEGGKMIWEGLSEQFFSSF
ncbi:MAG: hypothetical protein ABW019_11530 [Chitinophagaceae bacterium]